MNVLQQIIIPSVFIFFCVSALADGSKDLPYYNSQEFTPHWLDRDSQELAGFHKIPAFSLKNQEGKTVTEKLFANKVYVANFFFTACPGICPKMRSRIARVEKHFKANDEVLILSHSITPSTDSVAVLAEYAKENGIDASKWHLVTGDKQQIYKLAKEAYFANEDLGEEQAANRFLHTESLVLVDRKGHIRGIYNGLNKASVNNLIADIKKLLST